MRSCVYEISKIFYPNLWFESQNWSFKTGKMTLPIVQACFFGPFISFLHTKWAYFQFLEGENYEILARDFAFQSRSFKTMKSSLQYSLSEFAFLGYWSTLRKLNEHIFSRFWGQKARNKNPSSWFTCQSCSFKTLILDRPQTDLLLPSLPTEASSPLLIWRGHLHPILLLFFQYFLIGYLWALVCDLHQIFNCNTTFFCFSPRNQNSQNWFSVFQFDISWFEKRH